VASTKCGFDDGGGVVGSGRAALAAYGPTLMVSIGFDPNWTPGAAAPPASGIADQEALVDTGASISCIDSGLAMRLNLPIVDRQPIGGIGGRHEANMHLAQIHVPTLNFTIHGSFAAVDLIAGGQRHYALIGRNFLSRFTMVYEGRTGTVTLSDD